MLNRYLAHLEKQSSLSIAAGVHVLQNLAMKKALRSKWLSQHTADAFAQGVEGVKDKSFLGKAKSIIGGAILPEVSSLQTEAHHAGHALGPILKSLNKRQQVGMRQLSEGRVSDFAKHQFHKDPQIQAAYEAVQHHAKTKGKTLPVLDHVVGKARELKSVMQRKDLPVLSNLLGNISRGKKPEGAKFKPGSIQGHGAVAGGLLPAAADPYTAAWNSTKNIASHAGFKGTKIGGKISGWLNNDFVKKPFEKGLNTADPDGKVRKAVNHVYDTFVSPVPNQMREVGRALKKGFGNDL
jgi:hypothetical protein